MRVSNSVLIGAGLLLVVLTSTAMVASQSATSPINQPATAAAEPQRVNVHSAQELQALFAAHDYHWPPQDLATIPSLMLETLPPDLSELSDVSERKSLFLRSLLPIVVQENQRLREQRSLVQLMVEGGLPQQNTEAHAWLSQVAREMRVKGDLADNEVQQKLLRRLDEIPLALALAQAAIESGWGTSRFAREGNSLFGQWTYNSKQGLEPSDRDEDADHLVRAFPHLQASVRAYMRNLNTNRAYREFRDTRAEMRADKQELSAEELAHHLKRYSQRGIEYVKELQKMITSRTLAALDNLPPLPESDRLASLFGQVVDEPS